MDRTELFDEYIRTLARPVEATPDGFVNFLVAKLNAAQSTLVLDARQSCGSSELVPLPEDERYLVCADCGTRK